MKKKSLKRKAAIICGEIVLIVLLVLLLKYLIYQKKFSAQAETMDVLAVEAVIIQKENTEADENTEIRHDFEKLKDVNEDIYAWITIPDTKVDYPVLQSETDNKYLDTNLDGSSGYPGCIYSNKCNSKNFDDYITVLYGHNMKSGEMFGTLHDFGDADFFEKADTFTIETEAARYTCRIYAAVNYNNSLITWKYGVQTAENRDAFLESLEACRGNSETNFKDDVVFLPEDKLVVLSVCIDGQDDRRFLLVSKIEMMEEF